MQRQECDSSRSVTHIEPSSRSRELGERVVRMGKRTHTRTHMHMHAHACTPTHTHTPTPPPAARHIILALWHEVDGPCGRGEQVKAAHDDAAVGCDGERRVDAAAADAPSAVWRRGGGGIGRSRSRSSCCCSSTGREQQHGSEEVGD